MSSIFLNEQAVYTYSIISTCSSWRRFWAVVIFLPLLLDPPAWYGILAKDGTSAADGRSWRMGHLPDGMVFLRNLRRSRRSGMLLPLLRLEDDVLQILAICDPLSIPDGQSYEHNLKSYDVLFAFTVDVMIFCLPLL
jgi:hypothetical protein